VKRASLLLLILFATVTFFSRTVLGQGVQIERAPAGGEVPTASPQKPKAPPPPTAAEALYDHLQKYHLVVAKFHAGTRFLWTDRMIIEIADGPPPEPLRGLLAIAPDNPSEFSTWVHDTFETQTKAWQPGKRNPNPSKQGTDEFVSESGTGHCFVNPVYVSYVLARYPNASILIKGPTDPVLFTVKGQLRAVVSPWTQLPDGTPLL
jgi:hypothetical protein